jgi:hypothetical protein
LYFIFYPSLFFVFENGSITSCHHQFESAKLAKVRRKPCDWSMNWYQ